ncbi:hypothetical protein, variant 1 [Aphanomyces astaci]|uniref:Leucine-rich repeat-containing N-terminal plant-type domain-containing protein n=1 Tax=Aphanomyces astaci TaxID=112090 RepID=W4G451_APHAT|nr:hypothetical protein, variant 1 [Aphanomyces astaci]ETV74465.1 hypothetical protein, variant 1 [Aphanomyces astaci]|eukprot:XP_009836123.1 hypothetical protein, variant 1 [Aphanomyces astaci]
MVASVALTCAMLLGANAVLGVTTTTNSSRSSTTVSLLVSCPNRTNSSTIQRTVGRPISVCLSNGSAITSVKVIDKAINLSRRNISVITRLPPFVASIDLSYNFIQSIPSATSEAADVALLSLNLSHNALSSSISLLLASTVQTLDLSYNHIVTVSSDYAERLPRQLKTLSLKGNGLTSIDGRHLPTSLQHLDLTENSVESILVDAPSYALLSHPEFDLMIEPDQTAKPTSPLCIQPPPRVKDNFICLIAASQGLLLTAFVGKYMLGFVVVTVTAYALWQSMKQFQSSATANNGGVLAGIQERSTYISSNYLEPKTSPLR